MYESFYGLRERPFELTPNPRYLCRTPGHREALSNLEYGISTARGITLLIGEAGTGKTTLIRTALDEQSNGDALWVCITNPTLTRAEFIRLLAEGFGLSEAARDSKTVLLRELEALLRERRAREARTALIVDEAQSLPYALLEEVRLLANIETDEEKLLPVILAGQPELAERLNEPLLRQLKQRVALRCSLGPLTLQETATYIASRIRTAGGDSARLFTREAVQLIHTKSGGIPRTISVLCDNALISGFAAGVRPVSSAIVREVCRDFDLDRRPGRGDEIERPAAAAAPAARPPEGPVVVEPPAKADQAVAPATRQDMFANISGERRRRFVFF